MNKTWSLGLILMMAPGLSGCFFTGIESTPRITSKDVKRRGVTTTPEQEFASQIAFTPMREWREGDRRLVTSDRFNLLEGSRSDTHAGDTIIYHGYSPVQTVTGDTATVLKYENLRSGQPVNLKIERSPSQLLAERVSEIPFTVALSCVEHADRLLRGNQYYILTSARINPDGTSSTGAKYRPVTVTAVTAGTETYPLYLHLVEEDGSRSGVLMTVGDEHTSTRNFDRLMSFSDPHDRYRDITQEHWDMICRGEICTGMTRDEARLAVGIPADVTKGQDGTSYFERWSYDNGSYLIFVDGLLDSFRR